VTPKPVGQTVTGISMIGLAVNIVDGAVGPVRRDETWTLDVASGALSYVHTAGTTKQATATPAQVQAMVDALNAS
jgi:hypothetical protein